MNPFELAKVPETATRKFRVLSLGAGVQSTCLYLLALRRLIPPIDAAVFADTGDEPAEVYRHLEWMQGLGGPTIHIVRQSSTSLGDNLILGRNSWGGSFASIPAFTSDDSGSTGIIRRQCTKEYKLTPIERWVRRSLLGKTPGQRVSADVFVTQLIGISLDEMGRALRVIKNNEHRWLSPEFPLIHRQWTRQDCLRWMQSEGFPTPPRSACVFCPYKTDEEWKRLKDGDAPGWLRAVEIDRAIRSQTSRAAQGLTDKLFLHRSCEPLESINFEARIADKATQAKQLGFWQECHGMCGN
jgi:hypothetical protein